MPFQPLAVVDQEAPEKITRLELDDYKKHLLTLNPGREHLIYVHKGEPVMRKVKAVNEKGELLTELDAATGKLIPLYATVGTDDKPGEPKRAGLEGVEYVLEDTGRGKAESKDASGFVAAGAEENINVRITPVQKGKGRLQQDTVGVWQFVEDESQPEVTLLRLVRSTPRNDTPEGYLAKKAGLADGRVKKSESQLARATDASPAFKKDLQDKIDKYKADSKSANDALKQVENARKQLEAGRMTEVNFNKLLVKLELKPEVEEKTPA